jgi:hypothetical protein
MKAGLMPEGVAADDRFVRLDDQPRQVGDQAAGAKQLLGVDLRVPTPYDLHRVLSAMTIYPGLARSPMPFTQPPPALQRGRAKIRRHSRSLWQCRTSPVSIRHLSRYLG